MSLEVPMICCESAERELYEPTADVLAVASGQQLSCAIQINPRLRAHPLRLGCDCQNHKLRLRPIARKSTTSIYPKYTFERRPVMKQYNLFVCRGTSSRQPPGNVQPAVPLRRSRLGKTHFAPLHRPARFF